MSIGGRGKLQTVVNAVTALLNLHSDGDVHVQNAKKFMASTVGTKTQTDNAEYLQAKCKPEFFFNPNIFLNPVCLFSNH